MAAEVRNLDGGDALAAWLLALDAARYGRQARARPAAGAWREFAARRRALRVR
jgi:hypothetical protein